jgi:hypothetical protein
LAALVAARIEDLAEIAGVAKSSACEVEIPRPLT